VIPRRCAPASTRRVTKRPSGVTLVELLVAMVVLAMLAGLAIPGYRSHVLRANRTEARAGLLALATAQEKFHLMCGSYAAELDPGRASDCEGGRLQFPPRSERGYYAIEITAADAAAWAATAQADGAPQSTDEACREFGIDGLGFKTARDAAGRDSAAVCWSR